MRAFHKAKAFKKGRMDRRTEKADHFPQRADIQDKDSLLQKCPKECKNAKIKAILNHTSVVNCVYPQNDKNEIHDY